MNPITVVFSHGKETGPVGTKIVALSEIARARGHAVDSIDYRDLASPEDRVARLLESTRGVRGVLVLAGSSMGGYVSAVASQSLSPAGLFLMAPAVAIPGYAQQMPLPRAGAVHVIGGWRDDLIDAAKVFEFSRLASASLMMVDADHRLDPALDDVKRHFTALLDRVESRVGWGTKTGVNASVNGEPAPR